MPGIDGLEVVERLRRDGVATPVVFLTARDSPADRVRGLHRGADDTSPSPSASRSCSPASKQCSAASRRMSVGLRQIEVHDLTLDQDGREVRRAGRRIEMSRTEFNLLEFLMMNAGRVVSKQQILDYVWQYDFGGESTVVETYISVSPQEARSARSAVDSHVARRRLCHPRPEPGPRVSLRLRLVLVVLVLMAVGLVGSDVATATLLRPYLLGRVDERLDATGGFAARLLSPGAPRRPPAGATRVFPRGDTPNVQAARIDPQGEVGEDRPGPVFVGK